MPSVGNGLRSVQTLVPGPGRLQDQRVYRYELPFMTNLERGEEIISAAPQLYVDLDVESDGKAGHGSLASIGAVASRYVLTKPEPNHSQSYWLEQETFYRELKPASEYFIPAQRDFCEQHGLERERLMEEGTEPARAMEELAAWEQSTRHKFDKESSVLVAFNASFDFPWVDLEMHRAGISNPFGIAGYCIKSLAHILSTDYDWAKTSKGRLPKDVIPAGDFTHHALEDAIYQQGIHFALVGKIAKLLGPDTNPWLTDGREA